MKNVLQVLTSGPVLESLVLPMITNASGLAFEELSIGDRWQSATRTIELRDIQQFAELTGDHDRLHTDEEFASQGPFGQPVAHGMLGMSILAGLSSTAPLVQTAALIDVRNWSFCKPIFPGDTLRAITEIVDIKPHGRRHGQVHWYRQLLNQKGEKVQEGTLVTLVMRAKPLSTRPVRTDSAHGDLMARVVPSQEESTSELQPVSIRLE
ncbi:MAG: MaoC/PaaZ C-terminal domain-containing protein [Planctomycetota bacterium]|nr:MaoC/PaaZ C-terminal domain-containing protein [Planctomycetota bacterium]